VLAEPGRQFYQVLGYALVTTVGATSFPITIPSPDLRSDDKPRPDRVGLVIPTGAAVYSVGLRVPDMRRDRGVGTAFSGLVGTNTDRIKVADALANDASITTAVISTPSASLAVASGTIAPGTARQSVQTAAILAGGETLQVFVTNNTGTAAGSNLTSTVAGGTPLIVEINYTLDDDVAGLDDIKLPFRVEN
jgi:hypothetical protein